jgi:hypothetical protein
MATEAELQHLYQQLHQALDHEGATTMMDILGPYARHEPATKADLDALRLELRGEMAELRGDLRVEMAGLRSEMAEMGQRLSRTFIGTQGVTVAVIGLLLAIT